tara:strand:+ start:2020 stop:2358 length:339 start_codon:yes stop_codon:yes gene_type:complete
MKILIWVHKNDVMANKILTYHFTRPVIDRHDEYVQVILTHNEFIQLEDKEDPEALQRLSETSAAVDEFFNESKITDYREDSWRVKQFNRNRLHDDQIQNVDDMDQNNQAFGD